MKVLTLSILLLVNVSVAQNRVGLSLDAPTINKSKNKNLSKNTVKASSKVIASGINSKGGNSGGGGNLDQEDPVFVTHEQIAKTVAESRLTIQTILRRVQISLTLGKFLTPAEQDLNGYTQLNNLFSRFFSGPRDVYEVLGQIKINLHESSACKDPYSQNLQDDGSVEKDATDEICLSSFTLGQKLIINPYEPDAYKVRVMALIFHELAHLFGADQTDEDAVAIQQLVLKSNKGIPLKSSQDFDGALGVQGVEQIKALLQQWIAQIKAHNYKFFYRNWSFLDQSWAVQKFIRSTIAPPNDFLYLGVKTILTETEFETLFQMEQRVRVIWLYVEHVAASHFQSESYITREYIYPFEVKQSDRISVGEWFAINNFGDNWEKGLWLFPNVKIMIKKYETLDEAVSDIEDTIVRMDEIWPKLRERIASPNFNVQPMP